MDGMTQQERRIWLIRQLLDEDVSFRNVGIPEEEQDRKNLLRALMNVRPPEPVSPEFLSVQDAYLQVENAKDGIADIGTLQPSGRDPRLILWQGDITTLNADGIVNAANSGMCGCFQPLHGCIDNIIHSKAGIQLRLECSRIMQAQGHEEPTGLAKITPAYNLPCRYILHTVGPIVDGPLTQEHRELLASCYRSCLNLAAEHHLKSLAFCCISTGVFMFPNREAAAVAVKTVTDWLNNTGRDMKIVFNVFKDKDLAIYQELLE